MYRMAWLTVSLATMLACDPFASVQSIDTIDAYEGYLAEHGSSSNAMFAEVRLEELYLDKARTSGALADWDAYLKRFPKGHHHDTAIKERESSLYAWAQEENTPEAWTTFLTEYPKPTERRGKPAKDALEASTFARDNLTTGPVRIEKINLAEDPEGPLNGTGIYMDVTNTGDETIEILWMRVHYLGPKGTSLGSREWPVVAPLRVFPVPVLDAWTVPMKPGDTRTWEWTTGEVPETWTGEVKVVPYKVQLAKAE